MSIGKLDTFLRLLRFIALFVSVFFTSIYVACLTFHYEVIPQTLLLPLSESRAKVPFPPILEALVLEFFLELLREAGARLPTKVGQTMGIVGGIVIGTASGRRRVYEQHSNYHHSLSCSWIICNTELFNG